MMPCGTGNKDEHFKLYEMTLLRTPIFLIHYSDTCVLRSIAEYVKCYVQSLIRQQSNSS